MTPNRTRCPVCDRTGAPADPRLTCPACNRSYASRQEVRQTARPAVIPLVPIPRPAVSKPMTHRVWLVASLLALLLAGSAVLAIHLLRRGTTQDDEVTLALVPAATRPIDASDERENKDARAVAPLDLPTQRPHATMPQPVLPKLGRWLVRGRDQAGNNWEAPLVFVKDADATTNAGYFDWKATVASGREHFEGTFDPKTRKLLLKGKRIENPVGPIITGNYEAIVSPDRLRLTNGRWWGNGGIPGTWTAEWQSANAD